MPNDREADSPAAISIPFTSLPTELFIQGKARSRSSPVFEYKARIVHIVDADTVDLEVDLGFRMTITDRFRLAGINAWEMSGAERDKGREATEALRVLVATRGTEVTVKTQKDKREKYGRWLAELWYGDFCINHWLVEAGHAVVVSY